MTTITLRLRRGVKAYTEYAKVAAEFYFIKHQGDRLVIDGKALGVRPLLAKWHKQSATV